jgi:digeranylgeranylglycerophospholipid reductase
MSQIYHTIIIGAGIAGLAAGRFLKENTLILDKKKEIGLPVQCGEGISIDALKREDIELNPQWIRTYIHQIKRIMPNGKYIGERHEKPYALVLDRSGFEKHLASLVPWEIRLNTHVTGVFRQNGLWTIETDAGHICRSKFLVGADGPASLVAARVFDLRHSLIPAMNYTVQFEKSLPTDELQMYIGNHIAPKGYGWCFPLSVHTANVGILIKQKGGVKDYFDGFIDTILKPLYGDFKLRENKSGTLPINGFKPPFTRDGAFLIGDAGAFTDPIFEGGMNMALLTGRLCAKSINMDDPDQFQREIDALPFTGADLVNAQKTFFSLGDETLNDLGDVINGAGTSHLATAEGQKAFMERPNLVKNRAAIGQFAKTWQAAKDYLW